MTLAWTFRATSSLGKRQSPIGESLWLLFPVCTTRTKPRQTRCEIFWTQAFLTAISASFLTTQKAGIPPVRTVEMPRQRRAQSIAIAMGAQYEAILDRSSVNIRDRGAAWRNEGWQQFDPNRMPKAFARSRSGTRALTSVPPRRAASSGSSPASA